MTPVPRLPHHKGAQASPNMEYLLKMKDAVVPAIQAVNPRLADEITQIILMQAIGVQRSINLITSDNDGDTDESALFAYIRNLERGAKIIALRTPQVYDTESGTTTDVRVKSAQRGEQDFLILHTKQTDGESGLVTHSDIAIGEDAIGLREETERRNICGRTKGAIGYCVGIDTPSNMAQQERVPYWSMGGEAVAIVPYQSDVQWQLYLKSLRGDSMTLNAAIGRDGLVALEPMLRRVMEFRALLDRALQPDQVSRRVARTVAMGMATAINPPFGNIVDDYRGL